MENWVVLLTEGSECEGDWTIAQFDVARLAHDTVGVGDGEIGETTVVLFKPLRALCVGFTRHLRAKIRELLMELSDFTLGFELLEGMANGNGSEGVGVKVGASLEDVDRRLGREGIALLDNLTSDLAWFDIGVGGEHEGWSVGGVLDGGDDGLWRWSRRGCISGRVDEGSG